MVVGIKSTNHNQEYPMLEAERNSKRDVFTTGLPTSLAAPYPLQSYIYFRGSD